jgi:hypothetical protein
LLTIVRLPRFYNKFRLQTDRSTANAERAADRKLARLCRQYRPGRSRDIAAEPCHGGNGVFVTALCVTVEPRDLGALE